MENAPFLPDQRHAVKDYNQALPRVPFHAKLRVMHRLGPLAAVVLVAALDALVTSAAANCTCRAPGREFQLGQTACLSTPNGPRLATCAMVLNNSSWAFSDAPCTVSRVVPLRKPRSLARVAVTVPAGE